MARFIIVDPATTEPFAQFIGRLDNPEKTLKQVGTLMELFSKRSFSDQRFGDFVWPGRYPNQSEPFVNIAGLVADLAAGSSIKARRFNRRPALMDTSGLRQSIRSKVISRDTVEVGSMEEYAKYHQWGLVSQQKVTPQVKRGLVKFLRSKKGKPYQRKLAFLLRPAQRTLDTQVVQRPFLGIHDELEKEIVELVERDLTSG